MIKIIAVTLAIVMGLGFAVEAEAHNNTIVTTKCRNVTVGQQWVRPARDSHGHIVRHGYYRDVVEKRCHNVRSYVGHSHRPSVVFVAGHRGHYGYHGHHGHHGHHGVGVRIRL